MTRQFKPQRKFVPDVLACRSLLSKLRMKVQFRHVYRDNNLIADWLANVARQLTIPADVTPTLAVQQPAPTIFSPPPWPAREAQARLLHNHNPAPEAGDIRGDALNALMLGSMTSSLRGRWGEAGNCDVCCQPCHHVGDR